MSTANRVIKNTGLLYAKMGITMFISLYTTRLILNALGAEDFGVFNIVGGAIAMLGFLNAAMAGATQRFMSYTEGEGNKEKQKSIFNISVVLHIAIALIMAIVLSIAGYFFFNGILNIAPERLFAAKIVYASLIISTVFTVMTVPYDAVLNAHENMLYYSIVGIVESVLKLAVALLVVVYGGDKLVLYGILMAVIPLITMTIMRVYCHRKYYECVIAPKQYWNKHLMKEMTGFAGWNFLSSFSMMVSANGQGIILNHFFGTLLNASQGIANQLNGQLQALSSNMMKAVTPIMGKSAGANDKVLLIRTTLLGAKYSTLLFLLFSIPVFMLTPYILELWLKDVPEWTVVFVRFQLLKSFIELQFSTIPGALNAIGKIKRFTIWSVFSNLLQLPCIFFFFELGLPPYSMYLATIIFGNIFVYFLAIKFSQLYCEFSFYDYLVYVSKPVYSVLFLVMVIMSLSLWLISIDTIIKLLVFILITILIFLGLFYSVGCSYNERTLIINVINKLYKKVSYVFNRNTII